jgi:hypothetical protein
MDYAEQEEGQWEHCWLQYDFPTANALLIDHLVCMTEGSEFQEVLEPLANFPPLTKSKESWVDLPCGHSQWEDLQMLQNLSEEDSATFRCSQCAELVLTQEDDAMLELDRHFGQRLDYVKLKREYWTPFDLDVSEATRKITLTGDAVPSSALDCPAAQA